MDFSDFQDKAVINVVDGSELGYVDDLKFDPITGRIYRIVVTNNTGGFLCFFRNCDEYEILWDQIIKIGADVIIVNFPLEAQAPQQESQ